MSMYTSATAIYENKIYGLTQTTVDVPIVETFITDAEALVNSYVAKQYALPFSEVPPLVTKFTKDVAAYYINEYLYSQNNQNVNEWVEKQYERVIDELTKLSKDELKLTYSAGTMVSSSVEINMATNLEDIPLIFNVDDVYEHEVSPTLLDQIASERG